MRRFVLQGFDETTVDEIAADAGIAQKTFFNYFPTKQALFRELAEARIEELQVILEEERDRAATTAEKLEHCFQRLAQLLEQRRLLARDLILEVMRARAPGTTGDELSKLHASFAALLRDGQAAGTPFSAAHTFSQTGPFRPGNLPFRDGNVVLAGSGTTPGVGIPPVLISGRLAAGRVRRQG